MKKKTEKKKRNINITYILILFLVIITIITTFNFVNKVSLTGVIFDSSNSSEISVVSILVKETNKKYESSKLGSFLVPNLKKEKYTLIFQKKGFEDLTKSVDLKKEKISNLTIYLSPKIYKSELKGDFLAVANSNTNSISIINLNDNKVIKNIKIGKSPYDITSDKNKTLFTANFGDNSVSIIDSVSMVEIDKINLEMNSLPLKIKFYDNKIYVLQANKKIAIIDFNNRSVERYLELKKSYKSFEVDQGSGNIIAISNNSIDFIDNTGNVFNTKKINLSNNEPQHFYISESNKLIIPNNRKIILFDSSNFSLKEYSINSNSSAITSNSFYNTFYALSTKYLTKLETESNNIKNINRKNSGSNQDSILLFHDEETIFATNYRNELVEIYKGNSSEVIKLNGKPKGMVLFTID